LPSPASSQVGSARIIAASQRHMTLLLRRSLTRQTPRPMWTHGWAGWRQSSACHPATPDRVCDPVTMRRPLMCPPEGFSGTFVDLVPLRPAHAPALAAATAEDPSLYRLSSAPLTEEAAHAYIDRALADERTCAFAVVQRSDGRVVGSTRLCRAEFWSDERLTPDVCEVGYSWLARSVRGTSCNTDAKRLLLGHAFDSWRVHRVAIHADARNDLSRRAIERLGLRLDGVIRAERLGHDGTVRDTVVYSMLAREWPAARAALDARLSA
jgi:RimJ/RimL family protein N-acetyltransferase